ncbi:MAG TPA: serine/threonine-protein kinase [Bryobacteraceae bacterium]|nr:serine/threonine-protein kinase [Bryobacteraceae bacterium]
MSSEQSGPSERDGLGAEGSTSPENDNAQFATRTIGPSDAAPGTVIDSYHLLQLIGQGGMGEVWLAEQKQPVRRSVALKLIKAGMDTRDVVARFESERQALALMNHPAIAKVFDAGSTPQGRPYFVMEYVTGMPITDYCDRRKLTMRQRLELFVLVCEGVQHAHQKAIIHRDLKPSNILVGEVDGKAMPKIIDFGVAKATAQRLTAETMFTRAGAILGTPGYMSPEQAGSAGVDVDTRTDVYSLGVVLYELLVGTLPLDFRKMAFDEILRRLREEDALRPSTKLGTLAEASSLVAQNRGADPPTLARQLRGDLDAIALKALEKDRSRRYATPLGLAADIGRYLRDEPVSARPPSRAYQLHKLARRNRTLVASAAAIVLTLIVATGVSTREAIRAIHAERSAADSLKQSRQEAAKAQAVNSFLQQMLQSADPRSATKADPTEGRDVTIAHVLDEAVHRLDAGSLHAQPLVEAAARESLGRTFSGLGRYPDSERQYRAALSLVRSVSGHEADVATSEAGLAEQLTFEDKLPEAETLQRDALRLRTQLYGPDDPVLSESLTDLAITLRHEGKLPAAEQLYRRGLAIDLQNHRAEDATEDEHNLGVLLRIEGHPAEAEAMLRRALASRLQISGAENPSTAQTMNQLAYALHAQGKLAEAEQYARTSLTTSRRLLGDEHPDIAVGLNHLATLLRDQGKLDEAESMLRQSLAIADRTWGADQTDTAKIETNLGDLLARRGKLQEGERWLRESLRARRKLLPGNHPDIFDSEARLGGVLAQEGRFQQAEPLLLSAWHGMENASAAQLPQKRLVLDKIVDMYTAWNRHAPNAGKAKLAAAWKVLESQTK